MGKGKKWSKKKKKQGGRINQPRDNGLEYIAGSKSGYKKGKKKKTQRGKKQIQLDHPQYLDKYGANVYKNKGGKSKGSGSGG